MSDQEILEKVIQKAIDNGWSKRYRNTYLWSARELAEYLNNHDMPSTLIFNPAFAKALWGDDGKTREGLQCSNDEGVKPYWAYHLQEMVLSDNPIGYLEANI